MKKCLQNRAQRGQTMVFLVMVVVILAFIALWNFDLHKLIYIKSLSLNASDAAGIAGARWQAISLNLLGELNAAQAVSITDSLLRGDTDFAEARAIAALESRITYAGPMLGYAAAQQAAKNNQAYINQAFTSRVHRHAQAIRAMARDDANLLDYANMLDTVANDGIAAVASDFEYHILLDSKFYAAMEAPDWCWLQGLLRTYGGWQTWPPIHFLEPLALNVNTVSSLNSLAGWMGDPGTPAKAFQKLSLAAGKTLSPELLNSPPTVPATWYCFDYSWVQNWTKALQDAGNGVPYPFVAPVKSQYDVVGAALVMRVSTETPPAYFNKSSNHITSVSAAKPFGYLDGPVPASRYGLVLPAFHDARLITVDSAMMSPPADDDDAGDNMNDHMVYHVPIYLKYGPAGIQDLATHCQQCRDLIQWEDPAFRATGIAWLSANPCPHSGGGGGGGGGGGSAHGH